MVQPESEREDHLSSDDDINAKLPAVTDENLVDIATMCLEKSKQAERKYVHGIVDNGLNLRPYDKIDKYQQKVSKAGEDGEVGSICKCSPWLVSDGRCLSEYCRLVLPV
jgi:hypothetical protein